MGIESKSHLKAGCLLEVLCLRQEVMAALKLPFYTEFTTFSKLADVLTIGLFLQPKIV